MKRWLVLISLAGCEWPVLSLAERTITDGSLADSASPDAALADADAASDARARDDDDDASDEQLVACSTAAACPPPSEPERALCNVAVGYCVECINDNDCPAGERCEDDGDCED